MWTVKVPSPAVTGLPGACRPRGATWTPGTGCQTPSDQSACTVPEKSYGWVTTTVAGDGFIANRTVAWAEVMLIPVLEAALWSPSPPKRAWTLLVPWGKDTAREKEPSAAVAAVPI